MNITLNPEVPAITEVVIPAKPKTVTMTVTLEQFAQLRALVGQVHSGIADELFSKMEDFMQENAIHRIWVTNEDVPAISFKTI